MDITDVLLWFSIGFSVLLIVQSFRFIIADADLALLQKVVFGKKAASLAGQVVWITGASSGIGEHLAYELAHAGCQLILSARRIQELERVKKQCLLSGKIRTLDVLVLPLDVTDMDSHKHAVDTVLQKFTKIDILVNNAGRSQRSFIKGTQLEVDAELMKINYLSVISLTKAVLPHMINNTKGHIVVTSSGAGKVGLPMSASYSASKFALHGWFDAARLELVNNNINITMVCPGPVFSKIRSSAFTESLDKVYGEDMHEGERRMAAARCAELMAVATANKLDEVWISIQPTLLVFYLSQYMPSTMRVIGKVVGRNISLLARLNLRKDVPNESAG